MKMALSSLSDINAAYDEGRVHLQRFYKSANTTAGDTRWHDWSYAAGQPAYDARIGTAGAFNPYIASRNDAIWFPAIGAGEERRLANVTLATIASGISQVSTDAVVYDLLGVYPLIDGDSTDTQEFDNTNTLPRYSDGVGVIPILVNHVSPMLGASTGSLTYTDADGVQRTSPFGISLGGTGNVVSGNGATSSFGAIGLPIIGRGVKTIDSLIFNAAPGGLFAIYMVKTLTTTANNDGAALTNKIATEKQLALTNAWHMPRIYDGAWLGFFLRPNGGARTFSSVFGHMEFIWG